MFVIDSHRLTHLHNLSKQNDRVVVLYTADDRFLIATSQKPFRAASQRWTQQREKASSSIMTSSIASRSRESRNGGITCLQFSRDAKAPQLVVVNSSPLLTRRCKNVRVCLPERLRHVPYQM